MLSSSINLQWPPFIQRAASDILTDYGPFVFGNRPVRTRTPGGVGAGGETPPATRLDTGLFCFLYVETIHFFKCFSALFSNLPLVVVKTPIFRLQICSFGNFIDNLLLKNLLIASSN